MKEDNYSKVARTYPTVITTISLFAIFLMIFNNSVFVLQKIKEYEEILQIFSANIIYKYLAKILPLGLITSISFASLFTFVKLLIRDIGKIFPEGFIKHLFSMPTTQLLFTSNQTFSDSHKKQIFDKIKEKFKIDLEGINNKTKNNHNYLSEVDEAVALIREKTRDNDVLFDFNKIYGFWRNLTGGLFLDIIILLFLLIIDICLKNIYFLTAYQYSFCFIVLINFDFISFALTVKNGLRYAKRLYTVFLEK